MECIFRTLAEICDVDVLFPEKFRVRFKSEAEG
jgi:hypothetical protein